MTTFAARRPSRPRIDSAPRFRCILSLGAAVGLALTLSGAVASTAAWAQTQPAAGCAGVERGDETVLITLVTSSGQPAFGSGFVWDSAGRIVTNYHVASAGYSPWITYRDGRQTPARVMAASSGEDLAILQPIRDDGHGRSAANPVVLGKAERGEPVIAYGNPGGRGLARSSGHVRGDGRTINSAGTVLTDMIETSVPLVPGNSGGPLFDCRGRFVGINAAALLTAHGSQAGFTIPAERVARVASSLIADQARTVTVATASPGAAPATSGRRAAVASSPPVWQVSAPQPPAPPRLGVLVAAGNEGLTVLGVTPGTAGARAGLQVGDILRAVDRRPLYQPQDVTAALQTVASAGRSAQVEVTRGGRVLAVTVELSDG